MINGTFFAVKTVTVLVAAVIIPTVISNMTFSAKWHDIVEISGYMYHVVGLRSDGTVVVNGANYSGQRNVEEWQDIVQIVGGRDYTAGLKADGTVLITNDQERFADVKNWTDIIAIEGSTDHLLGLKSDGTCVAAGNGKDEELEVGDFEDIVTIYANRGSNGGMSMGISSTGRVYMTGGWENGPDWVGEETGNGEGQMRVTALYGQYGSVLAVSEDGACRGLGEDENGQLSAAESWDGSQIVDGFCRQSTLVLLQNGTVLYAGKNDGMRYQVKDWTDIIDLCGNSGHVLGLRKDGTVVAVGSNEKGECDVSEWNHIEKIYTLYYTSFGVKEDGTVVAAGYDPAAVTYVSDKNPIEVLQFWWGATQWADMIG